MSYETARDTYSIFGKGHQLAGNRNHRYVRHRLDCHGKRHDSRDDSGHGASYKVSIRRRPPFQEWEERDASQLSWLYERGKLRSMGRMTLITGAERRRRWGKEDRARILAAIEEPGAVVAEVARAADVCTSLVYKWRREARSAAPKNDVSGFASVVVEAPMAAPPSLPSTTNSEPGVIVVDMRDARVRIAADAPTAVIAATLKALRP